jgi:hypothetical protein
MADSPLSAIIALGAGSDTLVLANGSNTLTISGTEEITGGMSADSLTLQNDAASPTTTVINASSGNDSYNIQQRIAETDKFVYTNPLGGGIDSISGFEDVTNQSGADKVVFSRGGFTAGDIDLNGAMDVGAFSSQVNSTSSGANFIYNTTNTTLYYDADGSAGGEISIVSFDLGTDIAAADIIFIA